MRKLSGFSLMEMMVVLLVTAVVAAASAPMINKKLTGDLAAENSCPWIYTGTNNSIAYNIKNKDKTVSIGAQKAPEKDPRVYIKTDSNSPHILLDDTSSSATTNNSANSAHLSFTYDNGAVILSTFNTGSKNSVLIGRDATTYSGAAAISIGHGAVAAERGVAIGSTIPQSTGPLPTQASGDDAISIGAGAKSSSNGISIGKLSNSYLGTVAIGTEATSGTKKYSIAIGQSAKSVGENSLAIGANANLDSDKSIAIGYNAIAQPPSKSGEVYTIALGADSEAKGDAAIAIGGLSDSFGTHSTAVGTLARAKAKGTTAIGTGANAGRVVGSDSKFATAIGANTTAEYYRSTAIGEGATTTASNQIVLGTASDTVYIPGKLVVDDSVLLGRGNKDVPKPTVYLGAYDRDDKNEFNGDWQIVPIYTGDDDKYNSRVVTYKTGLNKDSEDIIKWTTETPSGQRSDRRLKDVGKAFTGGLEEVKKLEVFNYTFKDDKSKTPRVGVMAQDLEKIFPKAVTKGDDGFLRIRMEDMFYAVVNAVKELDKKLSLLEQKQKRIDELEERLDKLEKKLEKLEKKMK